jgi:hypothetical protein
MYKSFEMMYTKYIIYTTKLTHGSATLFLTPKILGRRGVERKCGLGHRYLRLHGDKETDRTPGAFVEGGSR